MTKKNKILSYLWKFIAFLILIFLSELITKPPSQKSFVFKPGEVSDRTILSPIEFRIFKSPDNLRAESLFVRDTITPVLLKINVSDIINSRLDTFMLLLDSSVSSHENTFMNVNAEDVTFLNPLFSDSLYRWLQPRNISRSQFDTILIHLNPKDIQNIEQSMNELLDTIQSVGLSESFTQNRQKTITISISEDGMNLENYTQNQGSILFSINQLNDAILTYSAFNKEDTLLLRCALKKIAQLNLLFDREWTKSRLDSAIRSIDPYTDLKVSKGAEILRKHQQISVEDSIKISSLIHHLGLDNPITISLLGISRLQIKEIFGRVLSVLIVFSISLLFIMILTPSSWKSTSKMLLFIIVIYIVILSSSLLIKYIIPSDPEMFSNFPSGDFKQDAIVLAPVALAGMLIVLLIGVKEAVIASTMLSLSIAIYWNYSLSTMLVILTGSLSLIAVSRKIHRRSNFYSGLLAMFFSMALMSFSLFLTTFISLKSFLNTLILIAISSTISVFFSLGLISIFERLFRTVTDMKLLELGQDTQPLLHKVARVAQGTKFHSLIVGDIAEAAAKLIGANPILTRVGAYYHDIGKIENPENFIENQGFNGKNIHDSISPRESVNILKKHVEHGVKLAKQYKLPVEIIEFIKTHHGTMIMEIFYHKAKDIQANGGPEVNEKDYRYQGPLPKTKEAGLVMLADGVEAACRSLNNPSEDDIKVKIHNLIQKRLACGQLRFTDLTLRDIGTIERVFIQHLTGLYHPRVPYPSDIKKDVKNSNPAIE